MNIIKSFFKPTNSQQNLLQELQGRVLWFGY